MKTIHVALSLSLSFALCGYADSALAASMCGNAENSGSGCSENTFIDTYGYVYSSVIGGGNGNTIWYDQLASNNTTNGATIGGGWENTLYSSYGTIGGGSSNYIDDQCVYGTIAGGSHNAIQRFAGNTSVMGAIGGGTHNIIAPGAGYATIGGGYYNYVAQYADYGTASGGYQNDAGGSYSTVSGGYSNWAHGAYSAVPGGYDNTAYGNSSFAAGKYAYADQANCFVWSDGTGGSIYKQTCAVAGSAASNAFVVRATGGVEFVTGVNTSNGTITNKAYITTAGAWLVGGGSWYSSSDKNLKDGFVPVDPRDVLERVMAVPITTWKYKGAPEGARHMGPTAQDFHAAFKLGEDDRYIATVDEGGVALAAIQALYYESRQLGGRVAALEKVNADANARAAALEQANIEANRRVASLEKRLEQIEAQLGLKK